MNSLVIPHFKQQIILFEDWNLNIKFNFFNYNFIRRYLEVEGYFEYGTTQNITIPKNTLLFVDKINVNKANNSIKFVVKEIDGKKLSGCKIEVKIDDLINLKFV